MLQSGRSLIPRYSVTSSIETQPNRLIRGSLVGRTVTKPNRNRLRDVMELTCFILTREPWKLVKTVNMRLIVDLALPFWVPQVDFLDHDRRFL